MKVFIITLVCLCVSLVSSQTRPTSPCDVNPCKNNGNCTLNKKGKAACVCPQPYFGRRCEKSPCKPNPCQNGGKCIPYYPFEFYCHCKIYHMGKRCELNCDMTGDLIIATQIGDGITNYSFRRLRNSIIDFIKIFNDRTRIGVVAFGKDIYANYPLSYSSEKGKIINFVENLPRPPYKNPRTDLALRNITENFKKNARPGYPKYVFVFQYKKSANFYLTRNAALALKRIGVTVYAIGIRMRSYELHFIASWPLTHHMFITGFSYIHRSIRKIFIHLCTDIRPYTDCMKCRHKCDCYPGQKCCFGCCIEKVTVRS